MSGNIEKRETMLVIIISISMITTLVQAMKLIDSPTSSSQLLIHSPEIGKERSFPREHYNKLAGNWKGFQ
ncbi:hypothetical protein TorRG33x02_117750, partial [Trema orientale]